MAEAHAKHHDYHLVDPSPWPAIGATSVFLLALGGIGFMHGMSLFWIVPGLLGVAYTMMAWWATLSRNPASSIRPSFSFTSATA